MQITSKIDTQFLLKVIIKNKYSLLISTIVFFILGALVSLQIPNKFISTSKFITKFSQSKDLLGFSNLSELIGAPVNNADPSLYLEDIIKDSKFLINLIKKNWYFENDSTTLDKIFDIEHSQKIKNEMQIDKTLLVNKKVINTLRTEILSINRNNLTSVVTLVCITNNPYLSLQINEYVLTLLNDYFKDKHVSQAKNKRVFIENRLKNSLSDLRKIENQIAGFREMNHSISSPKLMLKEQQLLRDLTIQQEIYVQTIKQFELAIIDETREQPLIEIINTPELPLYKSYPNRKLIVLGIVLCGVFISFTLIFLFELILGKTKNVNL